MSRARWQRSQTALEYVLLIAAAIILVVIAITIVRGQVISPVSDGVKDNAGAIKDVIRNVTG